MKSHIHFLTLAFADKKLEHEFLDAFNQENISQIRFGISLAITLFILYAFVDPYSHPQSYTSLWMVRLAIVLLLSLLLFSTFQTHYIQRVQQYNSIALFLTGIGLLVLYAFPVDTLYAYIFFTSFLLYITGTFVMVGLKFVNALAIISVLNVLATVMTFIQLDYISSYIYLFFFLSLTIAQAQGSYFSEKARRKLFLKEKTLQEKQAIMFQQAKLASMGEMVGNIAHQWRQPLNTLALIMQKIGIYHQRNILDEKKLTKNLGRGQQIIQGMSQTIDDFRDFFKPTKEMHNFYIKEAIHNAYMIIKPNLQHHNISYNVNISNKKLMTYGYSNEFSQVMINLLSNAKDALLENKKAHASIWVNVIEKEGLLYIDTCDNAGGIDDDYMDRIFEPYFTTKEEGQGTGIGLYMSKNIIESHMHGSLVAFNHDEGACFRIQLNAVTI